MWELSWMRGKSSEVKHDPSIGDIADAFQKAQPQAGMESQIVDPGELAGFVNYSDENGLITLRDMDRHVELSASIYVQNCFIFYREGGEAISSTPYWLRLTVGKVVEIFRLFYENNSRWRVACVWEPRLPALEPPNPQPAPAPPPTPTTTGIKADLQPPSPQPALAAPPMWKLCWSSADSYREKYYPSVGDIGRAFQKAQAPPKKKAPPKPKPQSRLAQPQEQGGYKSREEYLRYNANSYRDSVGNYRHRDNEDDLSYRSSNIDKDRYVRLENLGTGAQLSADVYVSVYSSAILSISYGDKSEKIKSLARGGDSLTVDDAVRVFALFLKDDPSWKMACNWEPPLKEPEPPSSAQLPSSIPAIATGKKEGVVYLLCAGDWYKIGKTTKPESRQGQLRIQIPQDTQVVHQISTDDIDRLERHWHSHFKDKRGKGEWFELTEDDVSEFRAYTRVETQEHNT